jgi:hypothetical protein
MTEDHQHCRVCGRVMVYVVEGSNQILRCHNNCFVYNYDQIQMWTP